MAKRPTPKKRQAKSQSSRRYKAFQNKARKRLLGIAHGFMHGHAKGVELAQKEAAEKASGKVTKIKA